MTAPIVNRYRMDRRRWLALHGRSDVRLDASGLGWIGLLLFTAACCVVAALGTQPLFLVVFLPIAAFSAYRIFLQARVRADRDFRRIAAARGVDAWDVVVSFEGAVVVSLEGAGPASGGANGAGAGAEAAVHPWSRVRALGSDAAGWRLLLSDGGDVRLDPAGFAPGGAAAFLAWLADAHPEVPVGRLRPTAGRVDAVRKE